MNASPKLELVTKPKNPDALPFSPELLQHVMVEIHKTGMKPGEVGYRVASNPASQESARLNLAANQFADDYALGVEGVRGERMGLGGDLSASPGGYTQTQLDAHKRYREAVQAVGMERSNYLHMVIIQAMPSDQIALTVRKRKQTVLRLIVEAHEKLADWYESPKPRNQNAACRAS